MTAHTAITLYGVVAVTFMMTMYALERRHPAYIMAFAVGCLASAGYGFLAGAWPFGCVETVWSVIAVRRYLSLPGRRDPAPAGRVSSPAPGSRREAP